MPKHKHTSTFTRAPCTKKQPYTMIRQQCTIIGNHTRACGRQAAIVTAHSATYDMSARRVGLKLYTQPRPRMPRQHGASYVAVDGAVRLCGVGSVRRAGRRGNVQVAPTGKAESRSRGCACSGTDALCAFAVACGCPRRGGAAGTGSKRARRSRVLWHQRHNKP